jgi:predicted PurR-regulated permease PerM
MLLKRILKIWINYLKSQLVLMVFIGVITYIVGKMVGLSDTLVLSIVAGVGEGIVQIGPIAATIPAVVIAYIKGSSVLSVENWLFALIIIAIYILIQMFENYILKPKIVGDAVNMHPILSLVGMTIFGILLGIPGLIFAIPVMATAREVIYYLFYEERK